MADRNDDGIKELDRDDPALVAPEPPETEHEQPKKAFNTTGQTEAHRLESADPVIAAQNAKAAKKAEKE